MNWPGGLAGPKVFMLASLSKAIWETWKTAILPRHAWRIAVHHLPAVKCAKRLGSNLSGRSRQYILLKLLRVLVTVKEPFSCAETLIQ